MSGSNPDAGESRTRIQAALMGGYARLADTGLLERPAARRTFEVAYGAYKLAVEAGPVHHLRDHVPAGSVVIDVGANIGFFTARFARWVGPAGRVVAVEPDAVNAARLRARLRRRRLDARVDVVEGAATDAAGRTHLVLNPHHPGDHKLGATGVEVDAVTVDDLAEGHAPRPVSLVKIDVQGAEELVLDGAGRTLERHRPALFVEISDQALRAFASSAGHLVARMADAGYTGHVLGWRGAGGPVAPERLVELHTGRYGDVLFLPRPAVR